MDELKEMFKQIQKDMAEQRHDMDKMQENILEQIQQINVSISEKFNCIQSKTLELENRLEEQQNLIDKLDQQLRRKNIVFFGVPETERSYKELEKIILSIINNNMDLSYGDIHIESVRRMGKRGSTVRPVSVTMSTQGQKIELLKNKHKLSETTIYIKEEFSQKILQKRKELQEEIRNRREQGEKVALRYDKIITLNSNNNRNKVSPRKRQEESKREIDCPKGLYVRTNKRKQDSPPTTLHSHNNRQGVGTSQSAKKNKTTLDSYYSKKQTDHIRGTKYDSVENK